MISLELRPATRLATTLGLLTSISGCDCAGETTEAVRCSTREVSLSEPRAVGALTLTPDERRLRIAGLPETSRWVLGRGPALALEPFAPVLDAVESLEPHAILVLGGLGTGQRLDELVGALADLAPVTGPIPVFFVPGPRDRVEALDAALEAHHDAPHLVSLAGVHVLDLGAAELLIASGTVDPRYALEGGCVLDDLDDVIDESRPEQLRVLVGFDAPSGSRLTRGLDGIEAGSDLVRETLARAEISAGIFAGPDTVVGRWIAGDAEVTAPSREARVIVPPLVGPAIECADGVRTPTGPTLVLIGPSGVGPGPS